MLNEKRKQVVIEFLKLKVMDDIPLLDTYLKDSKSVCGRDTLNFHVSAALFTIVKKRKTPRCLSINS